MMVFQVRMIFIKRRISQVSGIALIVHGPSIWSTKVPLSIILLLWYHKIIWEFFPNIPPYYWVCAKICQYWLLKNAKIISRILWRFIGKIWKVYFSGEIIFEGQNPFHWHFFTDKSGNIEIFFWNNVVMIFKGARILEKKFHFCVGHF